MSMAFLKKKLVLILLLSIPLLILGSIVIFKPLLIQKPSASKAESSLAKSNGLIIDNATLKALSKLPDNNSTDKEKSEFINLIEKYAESNDILTIDSKCLIKPFVLKTSIGKTINFKNNDQVDHSLGITNTKIASVSAYTVAAKEAVQIKVDFVKDQGVLGYGCDDSGLGGILFIVAP